MVEHFAPKVHIPERWTPYGTIPARDVTPEGWQWILAFAIRGCDWAIKEASKPEFRTRIMESLKDRRCEELKGAIEAKLREVEEMRKELSGLREAKP